MSLETFKLLISFIYLLCVYIRKCYFHQIFVNFSIFLLNIIKQTVFHNFPLQFFLKRKFIKKVHLIIIYVDYNVLLCFFCCVYIEWNNITVNDNGKFFIGIFLPLFAIQMEKGCFSETPLCFFTLNGTIYEFYRYFLSFFGVFCLTNLFFLFKWWLSNYFLIVFFTFF